MSPKTFKLLALHNPCRPFYFAVTGRPLSHFVFVSSAKSLKFCVEVCAHHCLKICVHVVYELCTFYSQCFYSICYVCSCSSVSSSLRNCNKPGNKNIAALFAFTLSPSRQASCEMEREGTSTDERTPQKWTSWWNTALLWCDGKKYVSRGDQEDFFVG